MGAPGPVALGCKALGRPLEVGGSSLAQSLSLTSLLSTAGGAGVAASLVSPGKGRDYCGLRAGEVLLDDESNLLPL